MKIKNISITYKLGFSIIGLIIITIISISVYSYFNSKNAVLNRTFNQLNSVKEEKKERINTFIKNQLHELNYFSKSLCAKKLIEHIEFNEENLREMSSEFHHSIGQSIGIKEEILHFVYYKNSENCFIINARDTSNQFHKIQLNENVIQLIKNGEDVVITDYINHEKQNSFFIFKHLLLIHEDAYIGYELSDETINKIMLNNNLKNGLGLSGEAYLVGSDYLMRSPSRFHKHSVMNTKANTLVVKKALSGKNGKEIISDYRGIKVLSSFGFIDIHKHRWAILSEIDYKETSVPVNTFKNSIIFLAILASFMLISLILILIHSITQPIKVLKQASQEIAGGNYNIKIPIKNNDELGQLSKSFNHMASKVEEQQNKLEKERKSRLIEMIDWQEKEKQRFSRELHDGLGQFLLSIKLRLGKAKGLNEHDQTLINESGNLLAEAVQDVRNISNDLVPTELTILGLKDAIRNLCEQISTFSKVKINYKCNIQQIEEEKMSMYIYRIIQESIHNIVKHSKADHADIMLNQTSESINLKISDNGIGYNKDFYSEKGQGLRNMRERVFLLDGTIDINGKENEGTIIQICIPCKQ